MFDEQCVCVAVTASGAMNRYGVDEGYDNAPRKWEPGRFSPGFIMDALDAIGRSCNCYGACAQVTRNLHAINSLCFYRVFIPVIYI